MTQPVGVVDGTFAGTDLHAVYTLQLQEVGAAHLPALAELPEVGPHATGIGKVTANLNMPFELRTYGWQLQRGDRISSVDQLRATSHRNSTIQALADAAADDAVPNVSVRLAGPVALMTTGWLPSGQRILGDPGARADIVEAWADGVASLIARIRAVLGSAVTLNIQEHSAHLAVAGKIPTASGAGFERPIDVAEVGSGWQVVADQDASVLFDAHSEMTPTAASAGGVLLEVPRGRSRMTERTWELIDSLVQTETPVGLRLEHRNNPQRYAEEVVQQYLDWGLELQRLEHLRLIRQFQAESERETGAGLQWLRLLADHAADYAKSL